MTRGMDLDVRHGNPWRIAVWGAAACLLLLPLVAMQFKGTGVDWSGTDFLVMGVLLAAACTGYEVGTRLSSSTLYRAAFGAAVLGGFLLVWIDLAVGIIGDND